VKNLNWTCDLYTSSCKKIQLLKNSYVNYLVHKLICWLALKYHLYSCSKTPGSPMPRTVRLCQTISPWMFYLTPDSHGHMCSNLGREIWLQIFIPLLITAFLFDILCHPYGSGLVENCLGQGLSVARGNQWLFPFSWGLAVPVQLGAACLPCAATRAAGWRSPGVLVSWAKGCQVVVRPGATRHFGLDFYPDGRSDVVLSD
jgi:hypothetical protein